MYDVFHRLMNVSQRSINQSINQSQIISVAKIRKMLLRSPRERIVITVLQSVTFDCLMIVILSVPSIRHRPYIYLVCLVCFTIIVFTIVFYASVFSVPLRMFLVCFCVVLFFLSAVFCLFNFIYLSCSCMGHVA